MHTPLETINDYYRAFSTLDVATIVSFFSEPSLTISPQGVFSAPSRAALGDLLAPLVRSPKRT